MSQSSERTAAALERLPEDMQERVVAYLPEKGDKLEALRAEVALGLADVDAGRVVEGVRACLTELSSLQRETRPSGSCTFAARPARYQ